MAKRKSGDVTLDASVRILALHGPNDMLRQTTYDQLRAALEAEHGDVDTYRFDGKAAQLAEVFDELRSYSLMQQHKLVVIDDAELFIKPHREALERYAANPVDHATLVLRANQWHKGKLDKHIEKVGAVIKCDQLNSREAAAWLVDRAQTTHGRKLDRAAAQALVDRLGSSLMQLDSELGKLSVLVEPKEPITTDLINEVVGRGSDESAWEVQQAVLESLADGSPAAALEKVHKLIDIGDQPQVVLMYAVGDLMRKFCLARSMKAAGQTDGQIIRALKLTWPPQRGPLFIEAMRKLKPGQAGRLFDRIITADARSKSGFGDATRNLECFVAAMADDN